MSVYISRSKAGRRRVLNESNVTALIRQYGFVVHHMEDLSVEEQIDLFGTADKIIAPHGAGLVNMTFCSSPCQVLEIYPHNYLDSSFRILANVLGFDYHCIIGTRKKPISEANEEDIEVDMNMLESWLNSH